jgi:integrase
VTTWKKIPPSGKSKAPPHWLEIREGTKKTSYRIRYRRDGVKIQETLKGEFSKWEDARSAGEKLIGRAVYGEKEKPKSSVTSASVCDEIVNSKKHLDPDTYMSTETTMRVHIKPFLNGDCAYEEVNGLRIPCPHRTYIDAGSAIYAADINPPKWVAYKAHFRLHKPSGSLFNHYKHWVTLIKNAYEKGLIKQNFKIPFDEAKEDFRKRGQVIPDADLALILKNSPESNWRARIIIGRLTGQRPGVIRCLRKDQVDLTTGVCRVEKADSKNRREYQFILPATALEILRRRMNLERVKASPYFFPMTTDRARPTDKHLGGWNASLKRAGITKDYTPHDLRHTRLSEAFKDSPNPALVCYTCDLSLDEAMRTYVHFTPEDTRVVALEAEEKAGRKWSPDA